MVPLPLFPGIPGGPELLVIFLIMVLMFGIPLVLIAGGVVGGAKLLGDSKRKDERVEELETRVQELERQLERERERDDE
jgi:sec-independent protein translocase protein TatA